MTDQQRRTKHRNSSLYPNSMHMIYTHSSYTQCVCVRLYLRVCVCVYACVCVCTLWDWSMVMKEGIMDFLREYLSCQRRSVFTLGSDATKNCTRKRRTSKEVAVGTTIIFEMTRLISDGLRLNSDQWGHLSLNWRIDFAIFRNVVREGAGRVGAL